MQASDLVYIVVPVVIPLILAIGVALPFIAASRAARPPSGRPLANYAPQNSTDERAPERTLSTPWILDR